MAFGQMCVDCIVLNFAETVWTLSSTSGFESHLPAVKHLSHEHKKLIINKTGAGNCLDHEEGSCRGMTVG